MKKETNIEQETALSNQKCIVEIKNIVDWELCS